MFPRFFQWVFIILLLSTSVRSLSVSFTQSAQEIISSNRFSFFFLSLFFSWFVRNNRHQNHWSSGNNAQQMHLDCICCCQKIDKYANVFTANTYTLHICFISWFFFFYYSFFFFRFFFCVCFPIHVMHSISLILPFRLFFSSSYYYCCFAVLAHSFFFSLCHFFFLIFLFFFFHFN